VQASAFVQNSKQIEPVLKKVYSFVVNPDIDLQVKFFEGIFKKKREKQYTS